MTWVWSLDEGELILRVQNIILSADNKLEGEPDRLVWVETVDSDPLTAAIEVEVTPWRMKTGERIIQDVFLAELDGPLTGFIVLLTDMDEIAARLSIPLCPTNPVQFFRPAQQGAYGIPVDPAQVSDGIWFVCAEQPLTFIDEDSGIVEPDGKCSVPYLLTERYNWAAQLTLNLPITVWQNGKELITLSYKSSQLDVGQPTLNGANPIRGLSSQVQPIFTDAQVVLTIPTNGERLLKQASLWVQGQDGWRWQKSLTELYQLGHVALIEDSLHCDFSHFLPLRPNFYTVELRISLQPLFSTPMRFAIVPGLQVKVPIYEQLYTPAKPFQLLLSGVDESAIVYTEAVSVDRRSDNFQQITWADLRHEPRLVLRFGKVIIPLAWSVPRFIAWLEPKPAKPQVALEDLRQITLHAVSAHTHIESFTLFLPEEKGRSFPLRRGRYSIPIGQSQLYDMVRKPQGQRTQINIQVGTDTWVLCEVLLRADLPLAFIEDAWQEHITVSHSAEDFLLQLIEMAEAGTTKFTPSILYRLATIPATVLDHFSARHLKRLWSTLAALKAVHNQSSWIETHGLLPAWILLPKPVILKTVDHGIPLRVHPIQVAQEGLTGKGYGRWRMSADDNAPKEMVYVQWQPISGIQVHVEAGLPEVTPNDWTEIELLDTYGLYYCGRCTRLTGVRSFTLPDTITKTHFHGRDTVDLRDITKAEEHGGYRLLAECFSDRREELLIDIFEKFEITLPAPADHLPEPLSTIDDLFLQAAIRTQFVSLIQEVTQYGADREESSPWASATRLLNYLNSDKTGGELRQAALALSMVLRLAAYDGLEFRKLLTKVELSEVDIQSLLAELHRISAAHLQWGLTWAELLIIHSPGKLQREDKK